LEQLSSRMTGPLRTAYQRALCTILQNIDYTKLEALLARGDVARAITELLDEGRVSASSILRVQFGQVLEAGASYTLRIGNAGMLVGSHFNTLLPGSPRAAAAMERLELAHFPSVLDDTKAVLKKAWQDGLNAGVNPRVVARSTRQFVGMTEYDYSIASSYDFALRAGDWSNALGRGLRDARYDAWIRNARDTNTSLTETQIDTLITRYQERLVKWRAETWSRTASLNAARESQLTAWQEAGDVAGFNERDLVKTWRGILDDRERPEHLAMEGETVPIDEPFSNGEMTPGESTYNCRCTFVVRVIPSSKAARDKFYSTRTTPQGV
jgi:Phage Mu protein F like protein